MSLKQDACVKTYLFACWVFFFVFFCRLQIFFKITFFSNYFFRNNIRVSNSLDLDQAQNSVGPDLGPTCLKTKFAARRQRVKALSGGLDLAVLSTRFTPNRQYRNQVHRNICSRVLWRTPSSEAIWTEQSCDLFQNKMAEHCLHVLRYYFCF